MGFDIDFGAQQHANPFAAFAQGQEYRVKRDQRKASASAGQKLATGDRKGAMADLGSVGMVDDVRSLQADQDEADNRVKLERAKLLIQVAGGLEGVPEGQRKQALAQSYPLFQAAQIDTALFDGLTEDQLTTPSLRLFAGNVAKEVEQFTLSPGSKRYDANGRLVAEAPFAPNYQSIKPGEEIVQLGGGAPSGGQGGGFDNFYSQYLAPAEGGYAANDGNGAPVNFGINQKSNPDVNVAELTPDQAKKLTYERYWKPSGADQLPPGLAEIQADTAFNMGVQTAQQLLQQSGGDPQRYLQLREQRYRSIAQANPDKARFLPTWLQRNQQLTQYVGGLGSRGGAQGPRVVASRPNEPEWVDLPGGGQKNTRTGKTEGVPKANDRLSATVVKMQNDLLKDLQSASSVNTTIDRAINQIDQGKLDLGPVKNVFAQGRNMVGMSDDTSRNFATFRASLEKMRNDSLRLNSGVQTEGDAQRAWQELIANVGDERLVRQRLEEIRDLNEQAIALRQDLVNQARQDSGMPPLDTNRFRAKPTVNDPGKSQQLPPQARSQLKPGQITTFANGQRWTVRNGQPVRVN